jgi:hypothetical protein
MTPPAIPVRDEIAAMEAEARARSRDREEISDADLLQGH